MLVQTADNVGIAGFIITGNDPKPVLLRGIGPSLGQFGVPNPLPDPALELHGPAGFATIVNDNWRDGNCDLSGTGIPPTNDLEPCIFATLDPGPYTAILKGKNSASGVALVEMYDVGPGALSKLAKIRATRAFVSTGADVVIAGFILGGVNTGEDNIIMRGVGPSLTAAGVPMALANPTLELRDQNGALLRTNNDWGDDPGQAAIITAAGLALPDLLESGIAVKLPPGPDTALLSGVNNGTGVGLIEIYDRGIVALRR